MDSEDKLRKVVQKVDEHRSDFVPKRRRLDDLRSVSMLDEPLEVRVLTANMTNPNDGPLIKEYMQVGGEQKIAIIEAFAVAFQHDKPPVAFSEGPSGDVFVHKIHLYSEDSSEMSVRVANTEHEDYPRSTIQKKIVMDET